MPIAFEFGMFPTFFPVSMNGLTSYLAKMLAAYNTRISMINPDSNETANLCGVISNDAQGKL